MKFEDFIKALDDAGWAAPHDGQFTGITELHAKLFPCVAKLESELEELQEALDTAHRDAAGASA